MAILLNFAKPIRLLRKATRLETPRNGHVCTWASPLRPTRLYDAPIMAAMEQPETSCINAAPLWTMCRLWRKDGKALNPLRKIHNEGQKRRDSRVQRPRQHDGGGTGKVAQVG